MELKYLGRIKTILLFLGLSLTIMGKEFKIMTYNIYGARLADGEKIGNAIKEYKPDFISLQEVDKNTKRSNNRDVTKDIADTLGYEYYYFQKARDFDGGEFGVSFISKYPVNKIFTYELPSIGVEKRQMLGAQITLDGKNILVIDTHLDYKTEIKTDEIESLILVSDTFDGDVKFLSGDFNMLPTTKYYDMVTEKWIDTYLDERENSLVNDKFNVEKEIELRSINTPRIDYIFGDKSNNWKTIESYFINDNTQEWTKISDHLPYVSIVEIEY